MFDWMAWTLPVAVFFSCIVLMLVGMTVWELRSPTVAAQGLAADGDDARRPPLHRPARRRLRQPRPSSPSAKRWSAGSASRQEPSIWISFVVSMLVLGLILRKG